MTFHTESVGTEKLTRQIRTEKRLLTHTNKILVRTKLNNYIRQFSDLKCTYENEPLKILLYSTAF